jgi:uncharacterized membrane protein YbjE (DUF340 family)
MKILGIILCIAAIGLAFGHVIGPKLDRAKNIQEWALFAVLLAVGLRLSQGKKKPKDTDKK